MDAIFDEFRSNIDEYNLPKCRVAINRKLLYQLAASGKLTLSYSALIWSLFPPWAIPDFQS